MDLATLDLANLKLSPEERAESLAALEDDERDELLKLDRPSDFYEPHAGGQVQFHRSRSIVRCLFPGNGFGKTRAVGTEVNWWLSHTHPYQPTPRWPVIAIWCCETFKQFKILRTQLETECFDRPFKFNRADHIYTMDDGGQMFLVSGDSSWTHVQGINPDIVIFDEQPPEALWNEMKMRRRGARKTRYCFAATATQGMTWMHRDLYAPWLKHHQDLGQDETRATREQLHPRLWVWARGGIKDNPGADAGDVDWYESQSFNSDAERAVRLGGGFADFSGTPVFDLQALERQKPNLREGEDGSFVKVPAVNADDPRAVTVTERDGRTWRALLAWKAGAPQVGGRVTVFAHPKAGAKYVIGHDSAYGLAKGDFDYAIVLDRETGEQVAEAQGHWGDSSWAEVLFGLAWHFNRAFLLGERQVGLMVMRRLYDELHYDYQYYRRDDSKRSRRQSDELGHHRHTGDLTIPMLRGALGRRQNGRLVEPEIVLRSHELWRQLVKFQFRPKREGDELHECHDDDLEMGAPGGDHDDGVLSLGYANRALREVGRFEESEIDWPEGSAGHLFGIKERLHGKKPDADADPFAQ